MGSALSCTMCAVSSQPVVVKRAPDAFLSIRFPSENDVSVRFPIYSGSPFILPAFIVKKIEQNKPFEVTIYDDFESHSSNFFFLPTSFDDLASYKRVDIHENTYDISPSFQQRNPEGRYYDLWLRLFEKDGRTRPIAFMVNSLSCASI